ncbi:aspartate:alanine exchanger family transporter [Chroococcus sp. FPU101]|uniref:aspartate:alanine exchanger family transporter n=1 Tax=Chroococcus sp. FPU101 TaxID=1974212 RepID=UPI001A8F8EFC|nr:TrkA C-terminal domain-containing protein [Chroococcus sp. FPU101]GFE67726.1 putative YidE/YbjL duplication [Chroococcus sp. FPU101]
MEWFWTFLAAQPLLTLFLVISIGYAVGEITIAGFSLGVGAVLFVGLLVGAFAPKASPAAILSTVGLILFFYGIGIQYGKSFIEGLMSPLGRKQNLIALVSVVVGGLVALLAVNQFKISTQLVAGIFSGALVNTAALQSVTDKVGGELPTVGYSVAYPFGVLGPILCMYFALKLFRPTIPTPKTKRVQEVEVVVSRPEVAGKALSNITAKMPPEVQIIAVRQDGHNRMPKKSLKIKAGDTLLLVGQGEALEKVKNWLGEETDAQIILDHTDLDDFDVYVSKTTVIGRRLGELNLAENPQCTVISIQRGDAVLYPHSGLVLEAGDRIWTVARRTHFEKVRNFFGNSARSTSEVSYLALGIGMVLGVLFGLIPFPLPVLGTFTFGAGGGAMIVSLILGWLGRTGYLTWTIPPSANLTLRNFGLTLFLAVAGMRSGPQFVKTVQETGFQLLGVGIAITLAVVFVAFILGSGFMRLSFDEVLGVVAGVTGNPAILAYAAKSVPTNKPELGYAIVFPTSTIIKIVVVQVLLVLFKQ